MKIMDQSCDANFKLIHISMCTTSGGKKGSKSSKTVVSCAEKDHMILGCSCPARIVFVPGTRYNKCLPCALESIVLCILMVYPVTLVGMA